jgi:hypothetical protein
MLPAEYADVDLMLTTGWTEAELAETTGDTIYKMRAYLAVKNVCESGGSLTFDNPE